MLHLLKICWLPLALSFLVPRPAVAQSPASATPYSLFARSNLVAWCIVPFDAKKRGPEERAAMLERLQLRHFAYDYRAEHIPTFNAELDACKRHGVRLDAWWFPTSLNDEARLILNVLRQHKNPAQLWVTGGGAPTAHPAEQTARIDSEAARIRPIALAAAEIGASVALYNHGGWFGEPENQIAIIEKLRPAGITNVGIVYNLHHGHPHLDRFPQLLQTMRPYLLVLNLNGMTARGDQLGKKILPIGQGDLDLQLLREIQNSGWRGPIGILNHTDEDAEGRLLDNLEGLEWLVRQLNGQPAGPKPTPKTWKTPDPIRPQASTSPTLPPNSTPSTPNRLALVSPTGDRTIVPPVASTDSPQPASHPWAIEDPVARSNLPELKHIPAAPPDSLTPANGWPNPQSRTQWQRSLGDATSSRFSSLQQIHRGNVKRLEVAWTFHSNDGAGNIQCNPIVVDRTLFAPTAGHHIVALDAGTGQELWRFQPQRPTGSPRLEDAPARRGLLYWPGDSNHPPRILFTAGNWIYALHPKSGQPIREFGLDGRTHLPAAGTVAGALFENILIVPGYSRDVFAYDVRSGNPLWTFHTVPKDGEFGHSTWSRIEDGANCWGGMALDESRGIAFISTGSPKPNFVGVQHLGDNLFANCLIALNARTGQRLWHFQEIAHDIWDWDIPAPPNLVTVQRHGRSVDAVAQVTKLGNTLLLDRVTGKPLYPLRYRRAPVSLLPGEKTAPYQLDPELPEPFVRQTFSRADITTRTPEARAHIEQRIASARFGWFEPFQEGVPTVLYNIHGGAEWTGAAFDPTQGHLFVSANEIPWIVTVFRDDPEPPRKGAEPSPGEKTYQLFCASCHGPDRIGVGTAPPLRGLRHRLSDPQVRTLLKTGKNLMPAAPPMPPEQEDALLDFLFLRDRAHAPSPATPSEPRYTHNGYPKLLDPEGYPGNTPPWGSLVCLDLNSGRIRWKVPLGEYPELTAAGLPKTGTENFGGAIVTAGKLVFCSGTRDRKIRAFDSESGEELWSHVLPLHGTAPPATYEVDGRQFIVLPATGGGKLGGPAGDAWVAFALRDR